MNKAILIGNLTRDPELRTTSSGISVCNFTIAVNRRSANAQGVREADFIPIVAWRQLAELCGKYLHKGKKVAVVGQIQTRSYDAQDGTKRYVTEVLADEVEFVDRAGQGEGQSIPSPSGQSSGPAIFDEDGLTPVDDDELPF